MTAKSVELALRVYPARYRELHGGELAATAGLACEDGGRPAALREAGSLVAHGLRLRLRISPDRPLGQILTWAAPLAVAADAAVRIGVLVTLLRDLGPMMGWNGLERQFALWPTIIGLCLSLCTLTALAFGRWGTARLLATAAFAGAVVAAVMTQAYANSHGDGAGLVTATFAPLAGPLVSALLLVGAPLGLTITGGRRVGALVLVAAVVLAVEVVLFGEARDILVGAVLVSVALLADVRYRRPATTVALALLPASLYPLYALLVQGAGDYAPQFRLAMVAALAIAVTGLLKQRRRNPVDGDGGRGGAGPEIIAR